LRDFVSKRTANTVTLINLIFGSLSLIATLNDNYDLAAMYILASVVMDGLDGRIARRLGVISDMGKELDSLCDLVSFGVAPALLLYSQVLHTFPSLLGLVAAVLYINCGAFRLARFNVLNIKEYFVGIPITLAGGLLALVSLGAAHLPPYVILGAVLFLAFMMISNIRVRKI
jgi:CDP-diacylglycerol---serine O-phosphatidyltransferase